MIDVQNVEHALAVWGALALVVLPVVSAMLGVLASVWPNVTLFARLASATRELGSELGKAFSEAKPKADKPDARGFVNVRVMALIATLTLLSVGCAWLQSHEKVVTTVETLGECVAKHAIEGESVSQIAVSCMTNEVQVITAILESQSPAVKVSTAHRQAYAMRKSLLAVDAGE